ncbi:MAG: hypothetical protein NUV48_14820 [Peptococcaceae bacterium]|nr:hypothetical protein [Peptococcaceae bacterium]
MAGRGNRHGEGDKAVIYVFTFKRNNEKDTRNYVYTEKDTREVTDEIFKKWPEWNESKTAKVVSDYYNDLFSRNMGTTFVEKLYEGASGTWSSLAGIEPFNTTYPQIPVFVPLGNDYLNKEALFYMQKFGVSDSESLYEIYRDSKYIRGLSFHERKQFFGLLGFFIVNLSKKIAERIGLGVSKDYIPLLTDPKLYSSDMGLGHLTREDDIPMCIVW